MMGYNPFTGQIEKSPIGQVAKFNVGDDGVAVIPFPGRSAIALVTAKEGYGEIMAYGRPVGPSLVSIVAQGGAYQVTTGVLTGTTGLDGDTSLSVHTDGNLYLENRSGEAKDYVVSFLNIA